MHHEQSTRITWRGFISFVVSFVAPLALTWLVPGIEREFRVFLSIAGPVAGALLCVRLHPRWPQLPTPLAWCFVVVLAGMTAPFFLPRPWQPVPVIVMIVVAIALVVRFLSGQMKREDEALRTWHRGSATVRASRIESRTSSSTRRGPGGSSRWWAIQLELEYEHEGSVHHLSTAGVLMPTPTYWTREEAEAAVAALSAGPVAIQIDPRDSSQAWPLLWLEAAGVRQALGFLRRAVVDIVIPVLLGFFAVCIPVTIVNATIASMLPRGADERALCMLVAVLTMFGGFAFTVALAFAGAGRSAVPPARSTAPRWLGAVLLVLVIAQLALVATAIRRHGAYDAEKAQRYGVEGLASWVAGTPVLRGD